MLEFLFVRDVDENFLKDYNKKLCEYAPRSCEYSYPNLFSWQDVYDTKIAKCNDFYIIKFFCDGMDSFLAPVGKEPGMKAFFEAVLEYEKSIGAKQFYLGGFVPEECEKITKVCNKLNFHDDRGNFDYIYETLPLKTFSGKKLHAKRNHYNKFLSLYGEKFTFENINKKNANECLEFAKMWANLPENKEYEGVQEEFLCVESLLSNFETLDIVGGVLKIDGKVCGITIASETFENSDTICIHIEKGLYDIKGVYPFLFSSFLKSFDGKYKFVNREDDVDDEGLRKSKLSYNPSFFVEKKGCLVEVEKL